MVAPAFEVKQKVLQLIVQRIVVEDHRITIEHVVPSGPIRLQPEHQSRRGARYLLQGLLQCQHCGYAFYGKPLSPSARKGRPRAYAYYRCVGTDAYRFVGHRLWPNTPVRPDRLELAVTHVVCALSPPP